LKAVKAELNNGSLPDDWYLTELGELAEILMGQSPKGNTYNTNGDGVPLLNGPAEFGLKFPTAVQWTTAPTRIANPGDILFCVRGNTTGRMNMADRQYCVGRGLAAVRGKPERAETSFVSFLLDFIKNDVYNVAIGGGSTFPNISRSSLIEFEVPVPPLPEQRKIAAVLGLVQRAIEQQERLIALAAELKKALLHKLFTEGLRGEPQKQTEIGPVPESWEVQTIQSLVDEGVLDKPMDGNHGSIHPKSEDYTDSGIPFVMASDLSDGTINFSSCAYLRKEQADRLQKGFARPGDVLISHKATIGVTAIVPPVEHYVMLTPQVTYYRSLQPTRLQNRFLKCFFDTEGFQRAFAVVARDGSTRSYIGITKQRSLLVAYPRIDEQREISEILDSVEQKILLAKSRQRVLSELFRTMLHELMTAQIRVNNVDIPELEPKS
jgi:type I restriction enzyme, S subunit